MDNEYKIILRNIAKFIKYKHRYQKKKLYISVLFV